MTKTVTNDEFVELALNGEIDLSSFKVVCDDSNNDQLSIDRNELNVDIFFSRQPRIYVEFIIDADGNVIFPEKQKT